MNLNPKPANRRPTAGPDLKLRKGQLCRRSRKLSSGSHLGAASSPGVDLEVRASDFRPGGAAGYLLVEALVYIGLVFLLLGVGSAALYRCIDNSVALRRNADDIARAVHAGEIWRADVRAATRGIAQFNEDGQPLLRLDGRGSAVDYRYDNVAVFRRVGSGPWSLILDRVKNSSMARETRSGVTPWRWELELQPKAQGSYKPGRLPPLFTFLAVPPAPIAP